MTTMRAKPPSATIFVRLIQHRLDHPRLNCDTCRWGYAQGDLADEYGRTIDKGGVPPERFHCELCPVHIMPEPDEITVLANEVYHYIARNPYPQQSPDMEFIFKMVGLQLGSEKSKAVYERVLIRLELEKEFQQKKSGQAETNGHLNTPGQGRDLGPL